MLSYIRQAFLMNIPLPLIGKVCGINHLTIGRYTEDIRDQVKKMTRNGLTMNLLKLYVSTAIEPKEFGALLGYAKKTERVLYEYLKLNVWKLYIQGVCDSVNRYSRLSFEEGIPDSYQKLILHLVREYRVSLNQEEVFHKILLKMHGSGIYPKAMIRNPTKSIQPILEDILVDERKKVGYAISVAFYKQLRSLIMGSELPKQHRAALVLSFDLPEEDAPVEYKEFFSEYQTNIPRDRACREAIRRLRSHMMLSDLPENWSQVVESHITHETKVRSLDIKVSQLHNELIEEKKWKDDIDKYPVSYLVKFIHDHMTEDTSLPVQIQEALLMYVPEYKKKVEASGVPTEFSPSMLAFLIQPIQDLDMSVRTYNCLRAADIFYVWRIFNYNRNDFLKFRNFGKKSLTELDDFAHGKNMHFGFKYDTATFNYLLSKTNNGKP